MSKRSPSTNHLPWRDWLPQYAAGSLPPDRRAAVEAHLATCAECREMADHWRLIAAAVRLESVNRADHLPDLDRALFIPQATESNRKIRMTTQPAVQPARFARPLSLISLAALLIFVTALLTIMNRPPSFGSFGGQSPLVAQATTIPSPTVVPTLTSNMTATIFTDQINGLPIPAPTDAATLFSSATMPLILNKRVSDQLTGTVVRALYTVTAPQDGLLEVGVESFDFSPRIRFYYLDSQPITYQDSPLNPVGDNSDAVVYVHVLKGVRVGLSITSKDSKPGYFTVYPNMRQQTPLLDSRPLAQSFSITIGQVSPIDGVYYSFDAKAGDVIDVRVKSNDHNDYTLYLEGYTDQYAQSPMFYAPLSEKCVDLVQAQQCFDDDSGGDTDPELHSIFVQQDRHYDVIIAPFGIVQTPFNYQITLTRTTPRWLTNGGGDYAFLSQKTPIEAYVIRSPVKSETIPLTFTREYGAKYPIGLTAMQDGQTIRGIVNNGVPTSPFTLFSTSTDPILIFVQYVGASIAADAETNYSLQFSRQ